MPPWLLGWAGAAVLCGSLFALGTHWPHPRLNGVHNRSVMRVAPALTPALGILGIAAFGALVTWGLTAEAGAGPSALHVWSAAALLSALVGDLTRPVNPWLATAHVAEAVLTSRHPTRHIPACPARLGRWPAAAGLLAFGAVELATPGDLQPRATALFLLGYTAIQVCAGVRYGTDVWADRGDGLGLTLTLFSRSAPLTVHDGQLAVRRPLGALTSIAWLPGTAALLAVVIGVAGFDSAAHHPAWLDISASVNDALEHIGTPPRPATTILTTVGLIVAVAIVIVAYQLGLRGMRSVAPPRAAGRSVTILGLALVPVAIAYVTAHHGLGLIADLPPGETVLRVVQITILTAGHVVALIVAHDRSIASFHDDTTAVRTVYWYSAGIERRIRRSLRTVT